MKGSPIGVCGHVEPPRRSVCPGTSAATIRHSTEVDLRRLDDPQEVCYFVGALTGSGAAVVHGVALKLASFASRRNDVLV